MMWHPVWCLIYHKEWSIRELRNYVNQIAWLNSLSREVHKHMENISLKKKDVIYNKAMCTMILV